MVRGNRLCTSACRQVDLGAVGHTGGIAAAGMNQRTQGSNNVSQRLPCSCLVGEALRANSYGVRIAIYRGYTRKVDGAQRIDIGRIDCINNSAIGRCATSQCGHCRLKVIAT